MNDGYGGETVGDWGQSGAGFNGDASSRGISPRGWASGLIGGDAQSISHGSQYSAEGGFGGGGASWTNGAHRVGGGGGYSGGKGGPTYTRYSGGTGGSYYNTTLISNFTIGNRYRGHGKVIVTFMPEYDPKKIITFNKLINWGGEDGYAITSKEEWIIGPGRGGYYDNYTNVYTAEDNRNFQLFENTSSTPTRDHWLHDRTYERASGSGIKLQFNRNKHNLTTLHNPWSTITKYGHYGNSYMNSYSNLTMSAGYISLGTGTIIFDFSRYMVITSFEWYLYHYYPNSTPRIKLHYWDDETNKWIIIFNGVSKGRVGSYSSNKHILHFRNNGINSSSEMWNNGSGGPRSNEDPPIKLHYAKEDNLGDYVTKFVRQKNGHVDLKCRY